MTERNESLAARVIKFVAMPEFSLVDLIFVSSAFRLIADGKNVGAGVLVFIAWPFVSALLKSFLPKEATL